LPRSSLLFEGRFGRIFRALSPAEFGDNDQETLTNLNTLAGKLVGEEDTAKDGADAEESGIPALYTYLGQFVDHDITFDPASSLQQQNDIDALTDYRTPRFDLDNIYGRGPDDQPYLYQREEGKEAAKLILGDALSGGEPTNPNAADLPRSPQNGRAIIGDPRNDENVIVSQFQGLFYRFHNRLVDDNPTMSFTSVQRLVRFHYQWMLINDFLPKLISHNVYKKVFPHFDSSHSIAERPPVLDFYHARNEAFMPLEFSVAAYRFGHSMVRPGYRLNDSDDTLLPIFADEIADPTKRSLRGFKPPESTWGIDWGRFIDIDERENGVTVDEDGNVAGTNHPPTEEEKAVMAKRLQLAYRIDTSIVKPLSNLPPDVADKIIKSLIERNLIRGWRLRLPSGQDVARAMGIEPLSEIRIGRFEDDAEDFVDLNDPPAGLERFKDNCPLWVYILAETFDHKPKGKFGVRSRVLGPVGGTIVAETFAGLLKYDSHSFLNQDPRWRPEIGGGTFGLKEFVNYAIGN
jgi:hypothetical protein